MANTIESELALLGWREWVALPTLKIARIKAKIDTGARSSALHAFLIDPYYKGHEHWVMFAIHPDQLKTDRVIECHAKIKDRRLVSDSGGHKQRRYVIETPIIVGPLQFTAEITLTNRDSMRFRLLIGRTAMRGQFMVNPKSSFCQGLPQQIDF
ncbi:MAG: ATP-dependent zinc protease [Methylococcaceae bacterium]|nr:ATP-dependent zinc protease [Methylococcaceae bacterium]